MEKKRQESERGAIRTATDRFAVRLADRVLDRPKLTIVLVLALVLLAASGVTRLEFSNNYRVFFGPDNPELLAFDEFQDTYTKNDNIMFIVKPEQGSVFTPTMTEAVEWLTAEAWKIPYAIRVDSVTNFQHSWANGDDLTVEDLIRDGATMSAGELADKQHTALAEPLLRGNLISLDADTTGINVTLQYPEESLLEVPEAAAFARDLAGHIESEYPGVEVAISGVSMLNNAFAESGTQDAVILMPVMFGVLVLFMLIVLRSLWGTLATLTVVAVSTATALGLAGWIGIQLTPISVTAAVIIMTLAIADSVHILVTLLDFMRGGMTRREAIRESVRINFLAVAITSLTTIVGFLTLNFSDSPPYWHLGNITAMGIAGALLYSVTLLPAVLAVIPLRVRALSGGRSAFLPDLLESYGAAVTRNYKPVLLGIGTLSLVLIALVPTIDLNDEFVKYFDRRVEFRTDAEFAIENLNGFYLVEYSLDSGEAGAISDPAYLERLEAFTGWLRTQPEVTHVYSYADIIKRLNKNMHGDDDAFYRTPEDRELAAQYLLLYELSLPFGLDLNDRISVDKSATRVTATLGNLSTRVTREFLDRADAWLASNTPESISAEPTGAQVMFSYISQRNINSMLGGNALAVLLIAVIMILALRSLGLGALSLIPNAVPILVTFGIWALTVRQVGMAAATVSATSLGVVVDDTVHFMTKYLRARREKSLDRPTAIRYAFRTVGPALVSTSLILAVGFLVLSLSTFQINSQMGLLTAIAIVTALLIDFTLLPALLMVGHRARTKEVPVMNPIRLSGKTAATVTLLLLGATFLGLVPAAHAGPNEEKGYSIAARSDRSDRGFGDSVVEMQMVLRNRAGKETTRDLALSTLEVPDEQLGDKSVIVFDSPADIEGTALLSHARILDPDDQWLYLPALKRVKRISSVNKSGPFVGSEFAFEDFTALELEKYGYSFLREEPCGELTCDVIERTPKYEHSGYTRQISWVDQEVYQIRKVEFYDRRGDLLKTLELLDYREYEGGFWRAQRLAMVNHQTGKSTDLVYSDYRFGTGLAENDFVRGVLQRVR